MPGEKSSRLHQQAKQVIPGGVNSPVRAFAAVGGRPPYIVSGQGARIRDADGREYIDCVSSWGPLILGHAHPRVVEAVKRAAARGLSFGAPTEAEIRLAERIVALVPGIEKVRLVNSGTEATMTALRLARAATGRDRILKFEGCYHGHSDSFLVKAGSGALTLGRPSSAGVPGALAELTLNAQYNDTASVTAWFERFPNEIAAVIVEPVAGNMGLIPPAPGFLEGLRDITARNGSLLIFDEVITGFRVGLGGFQGACGIRPDLTTLGKIIGGGLPVGACGGRADIMDLLAPDGPVYQAGTLSGNPLAVAAGRATLEVLENTPPYERLERLGARLEAGLRTAAQSAGLPVTINRVGSMLGLFFRPPPVQSYADAVESDQDRFAAFHAAMLDRHIYMAPSQFETLFISTAHTENDVDGIIEAAGPAFAEIRPGRFQFTHAPG